MADYETTYGLGLKLTGVCTSNDNARDPITLKLNGTNVSSWLDSTDADGLNNDYRWIADSIDTSSIADFPGWLTSPTGTDNAILIEGNDAATNNGSASTVIKLYDPKSLEETVVLNNGEATTGNALLVNSIDIIGGTHVTVWANNAAFSDTYDSSKVIHTIADTSGTQDEYLTSSVNGQALSLIDQPEGEQYLTFRFKGAAGSNIWLEFNKTIVLDTQSPTFTITAEGV